MDTVLIIIGIILLVSLSLNTSFGANQVELNVSDMTGSDAIVVLCTEAIGYGRLHYKTTIALNESFLEHDEKIKWISYTLYNSLDTDTDMDTLGVPLKKRTDDNQTVSIWTSTFNPQNNYRYDKISIDVHTDKNRVYRFGENDIEDKT